MNSEEKMMQDRDFDRLLKSKMESEALPHEPKGWDKLYKELHTATESTTVLHKQPSSTAGAADAAAPTPIIPFRKWAAIACGISLIAVSAAIWIGKDSSKQLTTNNITQHQHNTPIESTTTLPSFNDHAASPESWKEAKVPTDNGNSSAPKYYKATRAHTPKAIDEPTDMTVSKQSIEIDLPFPTNKIALKPEYQQPVITEKPKESNIIRNAPFKEEPHSYAYRQTPYNNVMNVGINGGYNFGTMNTGYALSIKAKANITKDVFIDGTVGIAMNNMNTPTYNVPMSNVKARPSGASNQNVNLPAVKNEAQQLLYMQVNPSVGYNVNKRITVSMGADLQRLVKTQGSDPINNNVYFDAANRSVSIIPQTDLGLTGKTEFNISKNISAGLIYREGINNLFRTADMEMEGVNYLNRRFMQVQFTYNIPVKL